MKTSAPLTKTQYGLYVECVNHPGEACYNLPYLYVLDGSLDGEKLCRAIEAAVAAHPTLLTHIELNSDGDPLQVIDDTETFTLEVENVADIEAEKQHMIVPFDIYNDRLFHIRLLKDAEHFYFFLDIHHIIGDGTTLKVMLADVEKAYNGETLEPEAMTITLEASLYLKAFILNGKYQVKAEYNSNDYTTQVLYRLGFQWPTTAADYVHRFVDTIVGFGFFER